MYGGDPDGPRAAILAQIPARQARRDCRFLES